MAPRRRVNSCVSLHKRVGVKSECVRARARAYVHVREEGVREKRCWVGCNQWCAPVPLCVLLLQAEAGLRGCGAQPRQHAARLYLVLWVLL